MSESLTHAAEPAIHPSPPGAGSARMTRRGLVLFAAMCVIWGVPYYFIRVAVRDLTPATLVSGGRPSRPSSSFRSWSRGGELRGLRARWVPLVAFAAVEVAVPWLLLGSAERRISSSLTGLLIAAVPLVATLIALLFRDASPASAPGASPGSSSACSASPAIVGFDLHTTSWTALGEVGVVAVCYAVGPAILSAPPERPARRRRDRVVADALRDRVRARRRDPVAGTSTPSGVRSRRWSSSPSSARRSRSSCSSR